MKADALNPKLPFLEIIEWIEENPNILMWKAPDCDCEIKNGAKLIVRESQSAILLNEWRIADIFYTGTHTLSTQNIPVLSSIMGWKYGFNSPFKADIYYFSTKQFVNLKWGTTSPILMRDSEFGQIRLRAFWTYNLRIIDEKKFFTEYAGTFPILTVFEFENQIRDFIIAKFSEIISTSGVSVLDMTGNLTSLSEKISPYIEPYFQEFGIEIKNFTIVSVSLPEEVIKYFDTKTSMNMMGDLQKFKEFNTAVAIGNDNSSLASGVQEWAAMGVMIGMMQKELQEAKNSQNTKNDDSIEKLQKLKKLFEEWLIDESEYKAKKSQILENF